MRVATIRREFNFHLWVFLSLSLMLVTCENPGAQFRGGSTGKQEGISAQEMESGDNIYISVVMVGRHDNMRGDYTSRLQNALDFFLTQGASMRVRMEIVIVEWNPLRGNARFKDLLRVPADCNIPVRVITVWEEFHLKVAAGTGESFFEFMAKNVGARRSRGKFVLLTNGDIVLSQSLMRVFATEHLDPSSFYRVARIEIPGILDPLSSLADREQVVDEVTSPPMILPEESCIDGEKECVGAYNQGMCEALAEGRVVGDAGHRGRQDEPYLPAAGDFFLTSREALEAIGGYHQVASTTHLDSLLVCKARGAGMRQVVLMRPCFMVHQRHPAPTQQLRFVLPAWHLSDATCAAKTQEAQRFFGGRSHGEPPSCDKAVGSNRTLALSCGQRGWGGRSMNLEWGFPRERFEETLVKEASLTGGDWQALSLLSPWESLPKRTRAPVAPQGQAGHVDWYIWRRGAALRELAMLRFHVGRALTSKWCAFEIFSRWTKERRHLTEAASGQLTSRTCRDEWEDNAILSPIPEPPMSLDPDDADSSDVLVSIIMAGKLDDRRGDSVGRMQNSIDAAVHAMAKHKVRGEVVIVEWIPVTFWSHQNGRQQEHFVPLANLLRVMPSSTTNVRVVTVHSNFLPPTAPSWFRDQTRFWEFAAKNVGARRAKGKWIVLTNSDVILPSQLFASLSAAQLHCNSTSGCYHRAMGVDVPGMIDPQAPLQQRLQMLTRMQGILSKDGGASLAPAKDFTLIQRHAVVGLGGYLEATCIRSSSLVVLELDEALLCAARGAGLGDGGALPEPMLVMHQDHPKPWKEVLPICENDGKGWGETKEQVCNFIAKKAEAEKSRAGGDIAMMKMQPEWGLPDGRLSETFVREASTNDWQWLSIGMTGVLRDDVSLDEVHGYQTENEVDDVADMSDGEGQQLRVVVCIASTTSRVFSMEEALSSIFQQTYSVDKIYLSLPADCLVPKFIQELDLTIVRHDEDLGPIHKLIDCASKEPDAETVIITLDDDMVVHPHLVERLVTFAQAFPDSTVGFSGWDVNGLLTRQESYVYFPFHTGTVESTSVMLTGPHLLRPHLQFEDSDFVAQHTEGLPRRVDVLEGYAGVAYRRKFLDLDLVNELLSLVGDARFADDVCISGHLAMRRVPRLVVPFALDGHAIPLDVCRRDIWRNSKQQNRHDSLNGHPQKIQRNARAVEHFRASWTA